MDADLGEDFSIKSLTRRSDRDAALVSENSTTRESTKNPMASAAKKNVQTIRISSCEMDLHF